MTYPIDQSRQSPNHASRGGADIAMIVLHATVGSFASSLNWLCNPASRVSTHYLIDRDGSTSQLVADDRAAWHAGRSAWRGMDSAAIANASIGIELVNKNDNRDPYPLAQLSSCRELCRSLIARYHIPRVNVVRHLDIARPARRKSDPASFPFKAFVASLYAPVVPLPRPLSRYRVLATVTAGATIRAAPRINAAVLGRLRAGDDWEGEPIEGNMVTLHGFGSSRIWIRDSHMRCVWSGLLERVRE